jgi:hypothetical protein
VLRDAAEEGHGEEDRGIAVLDEHCLREGRNKGHEMKRVMQATNA